MDNDLTGVPAYAWGLHKDAYYSEGGRLMRPRNIWFMTLDNYYISGFETIGRRPRYTVRRYATATAARKHAIKETQRREQEGFELHSDPRGLPTKGGTRGWFDKQVSGDVESHDLHMSLMHLINNGKELPALS